MPDPHQITRTKTVRTRGEAETKPAKAETRRNVAVAEAVDEKDAEVAEVATTAGETEEKEGTSMGYRTRKLLIQAGRNWNFPPSR